jgi:hypothetical protein
MVYGVGKKSIIFHIIKRFLNTAWCNRLYIGHYGTVRLAQAGMKDRLNLVVYKRRTAFFIVELFPCRRNVAVTSGTGWNARRLTMKGV